MNTIDGLKKSINSILAVRDKIGLLHKVYIVTKTWSGGEPGRGVATEKVHFVQPSPGIKDFSHSLRVQPGGAYQQGDIILTGFSKVNYPERSDLDGTSAGKHEEKFFRIAEDDYRVISVTENYLTWNVQVRKRSQKA